MKYILEIDFETERHCLLCPVRDEETDNCKMMYCGEGFESWEEQMKDCPLKLADEHCRKAEWVNGKCRGYQVSRWDDEPIEKCKQCKDFELYEEVET